MVPQWNATGMHAWPWFKLAEANRQVEAWKSHYGVTSIEFLPPTYCGLARLVRDEMNRRGLQPHLF